MSLPGGIELEVVEPKQDAQNATSAEGTQPFSSITCSAKIGSMIMASKDDQRVVYRGVVSTERRPSAQDEGVAIMQKQGKAGSSRWNQTAPKRRFPVTLSGVAILFFIVVYFWQGGNLQVTMSLPGGIELEVVEPKQDAQNATSAEGTQPFSSITCSAKIGSMIMASKDDQRVVYRAPSIPLGLCA